MNTPAGSATTTLDTESSELLARAAGGARLSKAELLHLYSMPAAPVREAAHQARMKCVDRPYVTYSIYGNIDYTNICNVGCKFCVYYRAPRADDAFTLSHEEIAAEAARLREQGVNNILLMGGINPKLDFDWYTGLLRAIKEAHPAIWIDAFSPEEIIGLERLTGRDAADLLAELKDAGMDALPGVSAEILIDEVRHRVAPRRIPSADWFRIVETAFDAGLEIPCVSMVFGIGETAEQRVEHLLAVRDLQDRAIAKHGRGFQTFEVWPMRLQHTPLRDMMPLPTPEEISSQYLHHVAVGRLAMDNIDHHRAVWRTMGFGIAGEALLGGADELSGTGTINAITAVTELDGQNLPGPEAGDRLLDNIRQCIVDAGFNPARRDPEWNIVSVDRPEPAGAERRFKTTPFEFAGLAADSAAVERELSGVS